MKTKNIEVYSAIASIILVVAMIIFRLEWMSRPTLLWCLLFWVSALSWDILSFFKSKSSALKIAWAGITIGGSLNAAVTVVNNGRMPVIGKALTSDQTSIWLTATNEHVLLFLVDNHDRLFGFSVGDVVLLTGILGGIAAVIVGALMPRKRVNIPADTWDAIDA